MRATTPASRPTPLAGVTAVRLCSVDPDQDHLIEVPLQQALVPFTLDPEGPKTVVLIAPDDVDRARKALERFGSFADGGRP